MREAPQPKLPVREQNLLSLLESETYKSEVMPLKTAWQSKNARAQFQDALILGQLFGSLMVMPGFIPISPIVQTLDHLAIYAKRLFRAYGDLIVCGAFRELFASIPSRKPTGSTLSTREAALLRELQSRASTQPAIASAMESVNQQLAERSLAHHQAQRQQQPHPHRQDKGEPRQRVPSPFQKAQGFLDPSRAENDSAGQPGRNNHNPKVKDQSVDAATATARTPTPDTSARPSADIEPSRNHQPLSTDEPHPSPFLNENSSSG